MATVRRLEAVDTTEQDTALADKPKLVATIGRGGRGKSTFVRIMKERASNAGRGAAIVDADRKNATLSAYFDGIIRPEFSDEDSVYGCLEAVVNQQADDRITVILDMGADDQVFKRFATSLELVNLLDSVNVLPVAVHVIGPDIDDLGWLRDIERDSAFCPTQTILVLNEGLIFGHRPGEAVFAEVRAHSIYRAAIARGAKEVWLPKLPCMAEINTRRLSFQAAMSDMPLTSRQFVTKWQRDVEKALAPVAHWLP